MTQEFDFERYWLAKFADCLDEIAGETIREQVMAGSAELSDQASRSDVIAWSQRAMERLDSLVDEQGRRAIMTGCACQYPKADLQPMREHYESTGDVDAAHQMLLAQFEAFLKNTLELDDEMIADIVGRGWGAAGVKQGNTIVATKIPKSGYLVEYMNETDPEKKR
jgi:hypothetical protein